MPCPQMPGLHFDLHALILGCSKSGLKTEGKDASRQTTVYKECHTQDIIELSMIKCVVGRVKRGNLWGIVDRSDVSQKLLKQRDAEEEWLEEQDG